MTPTGPSVHLCWAEMACRDGSPYPAEWRVERAEPLAAEFERVRAIVGGPLKVGSAYRTAAHNKAIGGALRSQHVEGRALDLYPPAGVTVVELYQIIRSVAFDPTSRINGIGLYPTFVHMDIRPMHANGRLTVWQGSRAWAESRD